MTKMKPSLLSHIREHMDHMRIADRTVIETDQGNIVEYEVWLMDSPHVLRMHVTIPESAESEFVQEREPLPMDKLRDHLNNQ